MSVPENGSIDMAPMLPAQGRGLSRGSSPEPRKPIMCTDKVPTDRRWEAQQVPSAQNARSTIHGISCSSGPWPQQSCRRSVSGSKESLSDQQLEQRLEQWLEKRLDTRLKCELQALRVELTGEASLRDARCHQVLQDDSRLHEAAAANLEARLCSLATAVEKVSTDFQKLVDVVFTELRLQAKHGSEDNGSTNTDTPLVHTEQVSPTMLLGNNNTAAASVISSTISTSSFCDAGAAAGPGTGGSHSLVADSNALSTLPESTTDEHLVHIEEQLVRLDRAIDREARLRRDFEHRWVAEMQLKLREVSSKHGEQLKRPQQSQVLPQQLQLPFQHAG